MTSRAETFLGLKVLLGAVEPVEAALDVVIYFGHSGVPKLAVPIYAHITGDS